MSDELIKPSDQFRREIEPALDDYLKDVGSERLANNLARAIDHQVDWTFEYYKKVDPCRLNGAKEPKSFRRQLLPQCPELAIMNDLSDAAHHRFLDRPNDPARITVTSTAAYSPVHSGQSDGVQLYIQATETPFLSVARKAVDFWRQWKD